MDTASTTFAPAAASDDGFPPAAIAVIAVGGYMVIFTLGLIIRKCIISKHGSCCPDWVTEQCKCQCSSNDAEEGCITRCATASNCFKYPSKQQFLDSCCPTKQWCDDTFCCCMSEQPSGQCCKWDDCCSDMNCGSCFDCPDCKDCCDDCKCECCSQPETIDCCCIECSWRGTLERTLSNIRNLQPLGSGSIDSFDFTWRDRLRRSTMHWGRKLRGQTREEPSEFVREKAIRHTVATGRRGREKERKVLEPKKKYLDNETILKEAMFSGGFEDIESCYSSDE